MDTRFWWWVDDTPKRPMALKIEKAVGAFKERFGYPPAIIVMNTTDKAALVESGAVVAVDVRTDAHVRANNFHIA